MWNQSIVRRIALILLTSGAGLIACAETTNPSHDSQSSFPIIKNGEKLVVIGIRQDDVHVDEKSKESLQEPTIGLGLTELVAQALFDSGKFNLIESDLQVSMLVPGLVQKYWLSEREYSLAELNDLASKFGVKVIAYGNISYSTSSSNEFGLGPFSFGTETLHIGVKICLYEATARTTVCRVGYGKADRENNAFIYQLRDNKPKFMDDAIGLATNQAVTQAVRDLVATLHFSQ